jgi:hypothetical protein
MSLKDKGKNTRYYLNITKRKEIYSSLPFCNEEVASLDEGSAGNILWYFCFHFFFCALPLYK